MLEWLEVRCCCVPQKLLGYMAVPHGAKRIQLASMILPDSTLDGITNTGEKAIHMGYNLPIELITNYDTKTRYRAIKAEGITPEILGRFTGFIPAGQPDPRKSL